jgi:hypothetical protein
MKPLLQWKTQWVLQCVWNLMTHGDAREGKWRGNWRLEWVASTVTLPRNVVYPALPPLLRTTGLPAFDWTDAPADLNGLVLFGGRRNLVCAHVSSHLKRSPHIVSVCCRLRYPACNTHAPYCHLWPAPLYHVFPHYLINGMIFESKNIIQHKMCVPSFSTTFARNIFHFKKNWARYYQ